MQGKKGREEGVCLFYRTYLFSGGAVTRCHTCVAQPGWLKQWNLALSQFRRLRVRGQCGRAASYCAVRARPRSLPSSVAGRPWRPWLVDVSSCSLPSRLHGLLAICVQTPLLQEQSVHWVPPAPV